MACSYPNRVFSRHRSRRIRRSATDKVLGGVCGGLADHFRISSKALRVCVALCAIPLFPQVVVFYLICFFLMGKEEGAPGERAGAESEIPPIPRHKIRVEEAVPQLYAQFDDMEAKIRYLEDRVTSREYILRRKFAELES